MAAALPHMASIVDNKTGEKVEEVELQKVEEEDYVDVDEEEFTCEVCHTPYHNHCPGCWECSDCDTCKCGPESHFYKPPPTAEKAAGPGTMASAATTAAVVNNSNAKKAGT